MELHLNHLFTRFNEQYSSGDSLGPSSAPSLLQIENLPPSFIKSLFRAAASLLRSDSWKRIRPSHLFGVRIGKDFDWPHKTQPFPFARFLGADGGDLAVHLFRSEPDARNMPSALSDVEVLRLVFVHESVLLPSTRRMIRALSLENDFGDRFPVIDVAVCGGWGRRFRNATVEELRYLFAFMNAVVVVQMVMRVDEGGGVGRLRVMGFAPFVETVDVQWPAEVARGGELVAVTVCYPCGEMCRRKKKMSSESLVEGGKLGEGEEEEIV